METLTQKGEARQSAAPVTPPSPPRRATAGPRAAATPTEAKLLGMWQELLSTPAIAVTDDFFVLGGHSMLVGWLAARVRAEFGVDISMHQVFETPTIAELAAYVDEQRSGASAVERGASKLVPLQPLGSRPPFFCLHSVTGTVFGYKALAQYLGPDQPVYGIVALGLADGESPAASLPLMVEHCVAQIQSLQPHGPYYLGGHSFAGFLALEVARELQAHRESVALVALFDTWLSRHPRWPAWYSKARWEVRVRLFRLRRRLSALLRPERTWRSLPAEERLEYLLKLGNTAARGPGDSSGDPGATPESLGRRWTVLTAAMTAIDGYNFKVVPYDGRIAFFQAARVSTGVWFDQPRAWALVARGGLDVYQVPGTHATLLDEPHVRVLAGLLDKCLEQAQGERQEDRVEARTDAL